jgi:endonuclease IV
MRTEEINDILANPRMANVKSAEATLYIQEEFTEAEIDTILTLLRREAKRCETIGNAPVIGYGSSNEMEKKKAWKRKAEDIRELESKIANSVI